MQTSGAHETIANDRLAKAIERNRARQSKRAQKQSQTNSRESFSKTPSLFADNEVMQPSHVSQARVVRPGSTRSGVARADTVKFSSNIESRANHFSTKLGYQRAAKSRVATIKRSPKKIIAPSRFNPLGKLTKKKKEKLILKVMWSICFALFLRLIFTDGGILDYNGQKEIISQINRELLHVKSDNNSLVKELKLIKTSRAYRKELVRKHLGFISSDEYLVLFAENTLNK